MPSRNLIYKLFCLQRFIDTVFDKVKSAKWNET